MPPRHALALGVLAATLAASLRCDPAPACPDGSCGPCRTLVEGDAAVTGDLRLDGHLAAALAVETHARRHAAAFEAAMLRLAAAHGLPAGQIGPQYVDDVLRVVSTDVAAHLQGPLRAVIDGSTCATSRAVAADAQARCELAAGCMPPPPAPARAFACDGRCLGTCDGACTGPQACGLVTPPALPCAGTCDGACVLAPGQPCPGACLGACDGACSRLEPSGACSGRCDGECTGACILDEPGACAGTCHGTCWIEPDDDACQGPRTCRGRCDGECTGECQGLLVPPSDADACPAAAACQAQAAAQAMAAVECSPAAVRLDYTLDPALDPDARAAFVVRLGWLEAVGALALEGHASFELLLGGRVDGEEVVDPAPFARIGAGLATARATALDGGLELPTGREACVDPALSVAAQRLAEVPDDASSTRKAHAAIVDFLRAHAR